MDDLVEHWRKFPVRVTEISGVSGNLRPWVEIFGPGRIFPTRAMEISDGTAKAHRKFAGGDSSHGLG